MTVGYTRSRIPPWGLEGGNDGTCNYVEVLRTDGRRERYAIATGVIAQRRRRHPRHHRQRRRLSATRRQRDAAAIAGTLPAGT